MEKFSKKNRVTKSPAVSTSNVRSRPVAFDDMANPAPAEPSASIRERVIRARAIQSLHFQAEKGVYCNTQMNSRLFHQFAWPDEQDIAKLKDRMTKLNMSARAFDRILRVARTIADLEYAATMQPEEAILAPVLSRHIAEAIGYRALDRTSYGQIFLFVRTKSPETKSACENSPKSNFLSKARALARARSVVRIEGVGIRVQNGKATKMLVK